jgi:hypothetical protein
MCYDPPILMYRTWSELSFTTAYTGVVLADEHAPPGHYEKLKSEQPPGMGVWYFEHKDGALWIATGGCSLFSFS